MQDIVCIFPTGYQRIAKTPYYEDSTFIIKGAGIVSKVTNIYEREKI